MSFVVTLYSASLSFFHLQHYFSFNSFLYLRLLFQMKSLPVDVYKNVTYKKHVILFCSLLSVHKQFWAILSKKCCKKRWVRFGKWGHINGQGGGGGCIGGINIVKHVSIAYLNIPKYTISSWFGGT